MSGMHHKARLICTVFLASVFTCLSGTAFAGERAAALVNSFQTMCTLGQMDFNKLDAKAKAMGLQVVQDEKSPMDAHGYYIHSKTWAVTLKSGPHALMGSEGRGPKGYVKGCAIGDSGVDADDFKAELVKAAHLGRPAKQFVSSDGARRITTWLYGSDNKNLMLADGTPKKQPGVYLTLMQTTERP